MQQRCQFYLRFIYQAYLLAPNPDVPAAKIWVGCRNYFALANYCRKLQEKHHRPILTHAHLNKQWRTHAMASSSDFLTMNVLLYSLQIFGETCKSSNKLFAVKKKLIVCCINVSSVAIKPRLLLNSPASCVNTNFETKHYFLFCTRPFKNWLQ